MSAKFHELDVNAKLKQRRRLSAYLDQLVEQYRPEVKKCRLTYIFCTDEYLLQMNNQFLNHDTLTDIITFDMSDAKNELNGEIYISAERIQENAQKFETTYENELHRVIFHGALHLCGFKDKTKDQKTEMRAQEENALKGYFND